MKGFRGTRKDYHPFKKEKSKAKPPKWVIRSK